MSNLTTATNEQAQPAKMAVLMQKMFNGHKVRIVNDVNGNPWFVVADIARILGIKNVSDAVKRLNPSDVQVVDLFRVDSVYTSKINGLAKDLVNVISESGLYSFILRSDKKESTEFRDWITREVLPSIRKTGQYAESELPAPLPAIQNKERPLLGFERMRIDLALRAVSLTFAAEIKAGAMRRLHKDVRVLAGNVKPGETLLVDSRESVGHIVSAIHDGASAYAEMIPLLPRRVKKPAPRAAAPASAVRKPDAPIFFSTQTVVSFERGPAKTFPSVVAPGVMAERAFEISGVEIVVARGFHSPADVEENIARWSRGKFSITRNAFGRAAKRGLLEHAAGTELEGHVQPYSRETNEGRPLILYRYSPKAVVAVLRIAYELNLICVIPDEKSLSVQESLFNEQPAKRRFKQK